VSQVIQLTVLGILLGGVYGLMATGLTLVYGVMGVINLAHAVLMIAAAYLAFFLWRDHGVDPFLSMVVTIPVFFAIGVLLYVLLFQRISGTSRFGEMTVLLSFGLALVIEGVLGYAFTGIYHSSNPGYATETFRLGSSVFVPKGQLYAFAASVCLLLCLWGILYATRLGYAIRATMQNTTAAQIVGVNTARIAAISFGIGTALAGAAGSLMSYLFTFFPGAHWQFIALLLSLTVGGGLGSLRGALVGAIVLSVAAAFVTDHFGPTWSYLTFYFALFLVLLVRPQGLFGREASL
jgi:branched-chain amino acid transport system permease protein